MSRTALVEKAKRAGVDWEPLGGKVEEDEDCQEARDLFQGYWMKSLVRQKGIDRKHGDMEFKEVLIANYELFKQGLNESLWNN